MVKVSGRYKGAFFESIKGPVKLMNNCSDLGEAFFRGAIVAVNVRKC
jgi:hypothetical protein